MTVSDWSKKMNNTECDTASGSDFIVSENCKIIIAPGISSIISYGEEGKYRILDVHENVRRVRSIEKMKELKEHSEQNRATITPRIDPKLNRPIPLYR